jgi:orotate phosphoribosyltransferase
VYLNPHQLFRYPSTIWRFAQDLIDVLPGSIVESTEVVAGPVTGGALLAHTIAGLLDSRRAITRPPTSFAPLTPDPGAGYALSRVYQRQVHGRQVLLVDDVRNTGQTLDRCAAALRASGGVLLASAVIYDRMEALVDLDVPHVALAEYRAPANAAALACPLCASGVPINTF